MHGALPDLVARPWRSPGTLESWLSVEICHATASATSPLACSRSARVCRRRGRRPYPGEMTGRYSVTPMQCIRPGVVSQPMRRITRCAPGGVACSSRRRPSRLSVLATVVIMRIPATSMNVMSVRSTCRSPLPNRTASSRAAASSSREQRSISPSNRSPDGQVVEMTRRSGSSRSRRSRVGAGTRATDDGRSGRRSVMESPFMLVGSAPPWLPQESRQRGRRGTMRAPCRTAAGPSGRPGAGQRIGSLVRRNTTAPSAVCRADGDDHQWAYAVLTDRPRPRGVIGGSRARRGVNRQGVPAGKTARSSRAHCFRAGSMARPDGADTACSTLI